MADKMNHAVNIIKMLSKFIPDNQYEILDEVDNFIGNYELSIYKEKAEYLDKLILTLDPIVEYMEDPEGNNEILSDKLFNSNIQELISDAKGVKL